MSRYLILHENSIEKAKEISAKIWRMTMPSTEGNVTQYYTNWIEHPTDGRVAIQVLGEAVPQQVDGETVYSFTDALKVHPDANPDGLVDAIGAAVTDNERKGMKDKLKTRKGGSASLLEFSMGTPSLAKKLKTREQMESDGWFPAPMNP